MYKVSNDNVEVLYKNSNTQVETIEKMLLLFREGRK
jgi:hypothetical protein